MNKRLIELWSKNHKGLKKDIEMNIQEYQDYDYKDILKKIIEIVLNENHDRDSYDLGFNAEAVTVIDDGDYQGTQIFIFPESSYQPADIEYIGTSVNYGSCAGCDTLQYAQMMSDGEEEFVRDIMTLSLHMVQKMKYIFLDSNNDEKYL